MKNELLKAGTVPRKLNSYYDKTAKGGSYNLVNNSETTIINQLVLEITIEAGENIVQGCGYCIKSDNKAYLATALHSDDKECVMVAAQNAAVGQDARFFLTGIGTIPTANFTAGAAVYLRSGANNISSEILAAKTAQEDVLQQIGTAISETQFIIEIDTPLIFE